MKFQSLPVIVLVILGLCSHVQAKNVRVKRLSARGFELRIVEWSHGDRLFQGENLYIRTNSYVEIFNFPDRTGQVRRLLFYKKISRSSETTRELSTLSLEGLSNRYINNCVLPARGEDFTVTYRTSRSYKTIMLHEIYLDEIRHVIDLFNDGLPDEFKISYSPHGIVEDCNSLPPMVPYSSPFAMTLSSDEFDRHVDSCITLLETKKLADISDSGNIYIILCFNTIYYTEMPQILGKSFPPIFDKRFVGGRYDRFDSAMVRASFVRNITGRYPDWQMTGSGLGFPSLHVALGGLLLWHSLIKVGEPRIMGRVLPR